MQVVMRVINNNNNNNNNTEFFQPCATHKNVMFVQLVKYKLNIKQEKKIL